MRILVEILHPAHVHFFKNAILAWKNRGDEVCVVGRGKDCTLDLLRESGIPFECLSTQAQTAAGLPIEYLRRVRKLAKHTRKFKPDVMVGIMGATITPLGRVMQIPSVVFYDTEIARVTNWISYRMATSVCLPICYQGRRLKNQTLYPSYHELAYLHPSRFSPDPAVKKSLGLGETDPYTILRFVSFNASHDILRRGLSASAKRHLISRLLPYSKVFISSEAPLPEDLKPLRFPLASKRFHDALAGASLVIGESATVCSEAAVLGVPSIYLSNSMRGYIDEQASRYGLVFKYPLSELKNAIQRAEDLLKKPKKNEFQLKRAHLLSEREDATPWIIRQTDQALDKTKIN